MKNWNIETVKLSDMIPQEDNPRKISAANARGLKASIKRFGIVELIVWNKRTGRIISGHQRYSILKSQGIDEIPVIVVDMDEKDERAASITMNNFAIEGEFDNPVLELLGGLRDSDSQLYASLRMENLKDDLSELIDKVEKDFPEEKEPDVSKSDEDNYDTECPCCGHKWKITPDDIALVNVQ